MLVYMQTPTSITIPPIYLINYQNETRKSKMLERFHRFNIFPVIINSDCSNMIPINCDHRMYDIMLRHMASIRNFYEHSDQTHCIICEDDVHISNNFTNEINECVRMFDYLGLDVMMLGYLLPFKLYELPNEILNKYFPILCVDHEHVVCQYPDDIWGCQMYMISRSYAKYLIDKYPHVSTGSGVPFSSDWIITKDGNRALIYPMLAVEEGTNTSSCDAQIGFHLKCNYANYDKTRYI